MIERLNLSNLLSFGPNSKPIELGPLNVLVGPNGSGKSNFVEALSLLAATPTKGKIAELLRRGGGVEAWINETESNNAHLSVHFAKLGSNGTNGVGHILGIAHLATRIAIVDGYIDAEPGGGHKSARQSVPVRS